MLLNYYFKLFIRYTIPENYWKFINITKSGYLFEFVLEIVRKLLEISQKVEKLFEFFYFNENSKLFSNEFSEGVWLQKNYEAKNLKKRNFAQK